MDRGTILDSNLIMALGQPRPRPRHRNLPQPRSSGNYGPGSGMDLGQQHDLRYAYQILGNSMALSYNRSLGHQLGTWLLQDHRTRHGPGKQL